MELSRPVRIEGEGFYPDLSNQISLIIFTQAKSTVLTRLRVNVYFQSALYYLKFQNLMNTCILHAFAPFGFHHLTQTRSHILTVIWVFPVRLAIDLLSWEEGGGEWETES